MGSEELGQMNGGLVCPWIKKLKQLFTLCGSSDNEDRVHSRDKYVLL